MRPGPDVTLNIREHLEDLHETDQAIGRLERRIHAQEARIMQLKLDGVASETAETLRDGMLDSLQDLIKHRALIMRAIVG